MGCSSRAYRAAASSRRARPDARAGRRWPSRWASGPPPPSRRGWSRRRPPLTSILMPLVPQASAGRKGLLIHKSKPAAKCGRAPCRSPPGRRRGRGTSSARELVDLLDHRLAAASSGWDLPAKMSWIGPLGVASRHPAKLRGAPASRIGRLYPAKRRAKNRASARSGQGRWRAS